MMRLIQNIDLHEDDFESVNGKVRTIIGRDSYQVRLNTGVATWGNIDVPERRVVTVLNNGFGIIHLDIKVTSGSTGLRTVGYLPAECPTPSKLIETQLWDGRSIYIEAGSREVIISSSVLNARYLTDIVGFFNVTR